jgi:hypothetical protein
MTTSRSAPCRNDPLVINHRLEQLVSSIPERKQRMAPLILKMSVSLDGLRSVTSRHFRLREQ